MANEYKNMVDGQEYEGRLVYVADLGMHTREYKGEVKTPCKKMSLGIEIIGETVEFDEKTYPRVMWTNPVNSFFKMDIKGKELALYKVFDPSADDGDAPDWEAQLGKPVNVTNKHVKKGDRIYDNIGALSAIPAKYQDAVGEATITPCIGDAEDPENACTKALGGLARWMHGQRIQAEDNGPLPADNEEPAFDPDKDLPF